MPDEAMFAQLAPTEQPLAIGARATAPKKKPVPIVPVPHDAPPCDWQPRRGVLAGMWPYHDKEGRLVGYAVRVNCMRAGQPHKDVLPITYCRVEDAAGDHYEWCPAGVPAPRPLYRLSELLAAPDAPVIVCGGEKKADAVPKLFPGYLGTTSMGGNKAPHRSDWTPLARRRTVANWPDNDGTGRLYAENSAALAITAGAVAVSIVQVPKYWPAKWDLADPLPNGVTLDDLKRLLAEAEPVSQKAVSASDDRTNGENFAEPDQDLLADLVERAKVDVGAVFGDNVLRQLLDLRTADLAAFIRLRAKLKTSAKVPIGEFETALTAVARQNAEFGDSDDPSQATMLVRLAIKADAELFHNALRDCFVTFQVGGHEETWSVRSKATRRWLTKLYFDLTGAAPNSEALQAALNLLEARAQFEGQELPVYLRVGEHWPPLS